MKLTKTFASETYSSALASWSWLPVAGKRPVQATLFGDVFLQDSDGFWFLDSVEGSLTRVAATQQELQAMLSTPEGQDRYLMAGLAEAAERKGLKLQPSEVFDFTKPPVLGGQLEVENLLPTDFVVSLNMSGQIHDQVRNLPPGTKISQVKIE